MDRAGLVMVKATPFNAETPLVALREPLTPTDLHYVRSNFDLPAHDGVLHVSGAVDHPLTLTVDQVRALPETTLRVTMECAGNNRIGLMPLPTGEPWAGCAVGIATWSGVKLHTILDQAGPTSDGLEVSFIGADHGPKGSHPDAHFTRSLPVDHAVRPDTDMLIAYAMNGEPLPIAHGAPFRLLVPGWYGMASVKWLQQIEVRTTPFHGPFQTESYIYEWQDGGREPVTRMAVKAIITDPAPGETLARESYTIRGKAWSGSAPVTAVDVSLDGSGKSFPARIDSVAEDYGSVEWSFVWQPGHIGRHALRARATDAAGNMQPDTPRWNRLGYGNNAVQVVLVDVL